MFHVKQTVPHKVLVVTGPTASGKTKIAVNLAKQLNGEVISADSRQIYRHMDLGTGKDIAEYGETPYHLIDILDPKDSFSVSQFQSLALRSINEITSRGRLPIVCGGTGHYIKALAQNYSFPFVAHNPYLNQSLEQLPYPTLYSYMAHLQIKGPCDSKRRMARLIEKALSKPVNEVQPPTTITINPLIFVIQPNRLQLRGQIKLRLKERLSQGMVAEVESLLTHKVTADRLKSFGLEYRWITEYLNHNINYEEMETSLYNAICQFAKRQETFFRYMQKSGVQMNPLLDTNATAKAVTKWLQ